MRNDCTAYASLDNARDLQFLLTRTETWAAVSTMVAEDFVDITEHVASGTQGPSELSIDLAWRDELYGESQPKPGDIICLRDGDTHLWNGQVESVSDYREARGTRSMRVTCRSRDASPLWRRMRWTSDSYPAGAELWRIAGDMLGAIGLEEAEILIDPSGTRVVHSNVQLADMDAIGMLQSLLFPLKLSPWIDARGRFKPISREVTREADLALTNERLLQIRGSRSNPQVSAVRLKWQDHVLRKSLQQLQVLGTVGITAGFFQIRQRRKVYWSSDRRQRAENTFLKVVQSCNSGLLPVATESYEQEDDWHGTVTLETAAWVPALATAAMATKALAHNTPDIAPTGGGPTIPVGRQLEYTADAVLFLTMMSIGTGTYEVWGTPFEYVFPINTTELFNDALPQWARNEIEIESDLIMHEEHAQDIATTELLYRSYEAQPWGIDILDDPRIECGDIVALPDNSRIYVTDYKRDVTRGAAPVLTLSGFRV